MSHLAYLREKAALRQKQETLQEETKLEIFIVNDLIQQFGRDYLDFLHIENQSFAERHNYKTVIRPIPIEAAQ